MHRHPVGTHPHPQVYGMQVGLLDTLVGIERNVCQQFVPVDAEEPVLHGFGNAEVEQVLELPNLVA